MYLEQTVQLGRTTGCAMRKALITCIHLVSYYFEVLINARTVTLVGQKYSLSRSPFPLPPTPNTQPLRMGLHNFYAKERDTKSGVWGQLQSAYRRSNPAVKHRCISEPILGKSQDDLHKYAPVIGLKSVRHEPDTATPTASTYI